MTALSLTIPAHADEPPRSFANPHLADNLICGLRLPGRAVRAGAGLIALLCLCSSLAVWPHGFAGNRIFPTTFEVDDPFVTDEATFMGSYLREAGTADVPDLIGTGLAVDYTVALPGTHLGLVLGGEYRSVIPDSQRSSHGFGNMVVGLKTSFSPATGMN